MDLKLKHPSAGPPAHFDGLNVDLESLPDHPGDGYAALRAEAVRLAGEPADILRRVKVHYAIYQDSAGNHAFPLVALHGALWAAGFFETSGRLGDALRVRYFYDRAERNYRMSMLAGFAEGFKRVNREVLIDTFTNYCYTKRYGQHPAAGGLLHPDLFAALNAMHVATRGGAALPDAQKRDLFQQALEHEQEVTVAPGVQSEVDKFNCPILRFLCLRPIVHLAYFPRQTFFFFRNFADKDERIAKAMRSYDLASRAGWTAVEAAMHSSKLVLGRQSEEPSA
jgi:hypothetical protein